MFLDTIDVLCLVYSNLCSNEIIYKIHERPLTYLLYFFYCHINLNELDIKYQSYLKSRNIQSFKQKIWINPSPAGYCMTIRLQQHNVKRWLDEAVPSFKAQEYWKIPFGKQIVKEQFGWVLSIENKCIC